MIRWIGKIWNFLFKTHDHRGEWKSGYIYETAPGWPSPRRRILCRYFKCTICGEYQMDNSKRAVQLATAILKKTGRWKE